MAAKVKRGAGESGGNCASLEVHGFRVRLADESPIEKNAFAFGYWTEKHVELERKVNLRAAIERAGTDAEKLKDIRGMLAPLLRDTLVAYNYIHYAPPGAQVLYTNPVFVRSHDFLGVQGTNHMWRAGRSILELVGCSNGGGRLVGSLAGLPYALAEAEQNFLIPAQTQALIWGDLVPQIIQSAVIPRWWNVTPAQLHWVALHMRYAEALLAESALDPALLRKTGAACIRRARRSAGQKPIGQVDELLRSWRRQGGAFEMVTPSELFLFGLSDGSPGSAGRGGSRFWRRRSRLMADRSINRLA